mgnify:CR=1 FL=1
MKHNFMTKMVSALLAVVLSTAAFSITAFASGGEESTESVAEQETAGDVSDLLSALAGSQVTVSVTEDGIQFSSGENDSGQTGTVTTGGGNLNVRTGAGMDYTAFTQLPNGTTVKVIGTDGDWLKVILPEKVGYVYSGYMTVSDGEAGSGEGPFSLDAETLENLLGDAGRRFEWRCRLDAGWEPVTDRRYRQSHRRRKAVYHGGNEKRKCVLSYYRP